MKKTYIIPQIEVMLSEQCLPIAESLQVENIARDGVAGDVKEQGDWADIWED